MLFCVSDSVPKPGQPNTPYLRNTPYISYRGLNLVICCIFLNQGDLDLHTHIYIYIYIHIHVRVYMCMWEVLRALAYSDVCAEVYRYAACLLLGVSALVLIESGSQPEQAHVICSLVDFVVLFWFRTMYSEILLQTSMSGYPEVGFSVRFREDCGVIGVGLRFPPGSPKASWQRGSVRSQVPWRDVQCGDTEGNQQQLTNSGFRV